MRRFRSPAGAEGRDARHGAAISRRALPLCRLLPLLLAALLLPAAAAPPDPRTLLLGCAVPRGERAAFGARADGAGADVWGAEGRDGERIAVRVEPEARAEIERIAGAACDVLAEDVYAGIALSGGTAGPAGAQMDAPREGTFLARFPRYDETVAYLRGLAAGLPAGVNGSLESIGESVEGRDIWVFRLTGAAGRAEEKKQIWINGLLHAREWITLTTALYILSSLINSHSTAPELLDRFEWLFCPLANPDGYEYTQTTDRFWRKNRSGPGVDLNRNFPYQWGREPGSSGNPNAGSYRGPAPLSEPESAAVHKYVMGLTRRSAMVDLHSYGQLVLRSWGFGNAVPPEDGEIAALSASIVGRIRAATGAEYAAIRSAQLYPASGTMADWAAAAGMLAFTAELRSDAGGRGFVLPPEDIVPVGRDGWAMVQELAGFLLSAEGRGFVWGAEGVPSDGGYVLDGRAVTGGLPEGWRPTVPVLPPIYDPAPGTTATATTTTAVVRTTSLRLKSTKRGRTTSRRKKTTSRRRKTTTRRKTTKRRTSTRRRARW